MVKYRSFRNIAVRSFVDKPQLHLGRFDLAARVLLRCYKGRGVVRDKLSVFDCGGIGWG